jgi:thymidylate synthase (FAD)
MNVKLISLTKPIASDLSHFSTEDLIAHAARVSNPSNQMNTETAPKLLKYLIKHSHWSPFELVSATVEIQTSRAIAAQILRHRSFTFQEFSQRYSKASEMEVYPARRQDLKNKQNSLDDMSEDDREWFEVAQQTVWSQSRSLYDAALAKGIAKEQARMLLPLNTSTTLYMSGTLRSWLHYLNLRCDKDTQLEHREIAEAIKKELAQHFPNVFEAMWGEK